ncbi:MAG: hypothetical protein ABI740_03045 [Alphaproteobacteria bacterium]
MRHGVIALAAGFLAAGYLVAPALAQKPQADDTIWLKFDLAGGCFAYETKLFDMVPNAPKAIATWSGACKAGEPISGAGTLTLKRSPVNGLDTQRSYKGSFTAGYLDGLVTIRESYQSLTDKADRGAEPVRTFPYRMGCMLLSTGEPESGSQGSRQFKCRPKTAGVAPAGVQ